MKNEERIFLIDLEDVQSGGLMGTQMLKNTDTLHIFHSENASRTSMEAVKELKNSPARIKYYKLNKMGRNALEFQLVALLASLVGMKKEGNFFLISSNTYEIPAAFLKKEYSNYHFSIQTSTSIQDAITEQDINLYKRRKRIA